MGRFANPALLGMLLLPTWSHAQEHDAGPRLPLASPVAATDLFVFRSDALFNLHDFLLWNAQVEQPVEPRPGCVEALDEPDREAFERVLTHYAGAFGAAPPFDRLGVGLRYELAGFPEVEIVPDSAMAPTLAMLRAAAPAYEACWWADHDARNRAWIAEVVQLLTPHEEVLRARHADAYGADWGAPIPVDVVGYAGRAGAATLVNPHHILVSGADSRHHGDAALEILFHEASHTLFGPGNGAVWHALAETTTAPDAERLAQAVWHPILFYTSGKLVQTRLAEHGVRDYEPYMYRHGLFEGAWPRYREPLEGHGSLTWTA